MKCKMFEIGDRYIFKCAFNSGVIEVKKEHISDALEYLKYLSKNVQSNCTSASHFGNIIEHNHVYKQHIDYAIKMLSEKDYVDLELLKDIKGNKEKLLSMSVNALRNTYDVLKKGKDNE